MKYIKLDQDSYNQITWSEEVESINVIDIDISDEQLDTWTSYPNLEELSFKKCDLMSLKFKEMKIKSLYLESCTIKDWSFVNCFDNLEELFIRNMEDIDLKQLKYVGQLKTLCINYTNVEDTYDLSSLDSIEKLDISHSNIVDISTLLSIKKLKILMLDNDQYNHNKTILAELHNVLIANENGDEYE